MKPFQYALPKPINFISHAIVVYHMHRSAYSRTEPDEAKSPLRNSAQKKHSQHKCTLNVVC